MAKREVKKEDWQAVKGYKRILVGTGQKQALEEYENLLSPH